MRALVLIAVTAILMSGCDNGESGPPKVELTLRRVPLRITRIAKKNAVEFAVKVLAGESIETPYGTIPVDAGLILHNLITTQSVFAEVEDDTPVLLLIDKRSNKFYCWRLHPEVGQITLASEASDAVVLKVINKKPLQIELWVDTDSPIDINVEFKESEQDSEESS